MSVGTVIDSAGIKVIDGSNIPARYLAVPDVGSRRDSMEREPGTAASVGNL